MKLLKLSAIALTTIGSMIFTSCLKDGDETIQVGNNDPFSTFANTGIPDDSMAGESPKIESDEINTNIPNISYAPVIEDGTAIINIDMTGISDPSTNDWIKLFGTGEGNQNVWIDVDGQPKGVLVINNGDDASKVRPVDLVFLVDNSGSMSDEANAIAGDIVSWAESLENSGLDIRFGCVGYDGRITGGINMTSYQELSSFLNYSSGTSRTMHWGGSDANALSSATSSYNLSYCEENGVAALRFADEHFSFRSNANRIYVNFTDEYNEVQRSRFTVESLKTDWNTNQGTVHTVYSAPKSDKNNSGVSEQPWLMSDYTGGTIIFADSRFTNVTLESLPVTGAMRNSYLLRITNIDKYINDGQDHLVRVTIDTPTVHTFRDYVVRFVSE